METKRMLIMMVVCLTIVLGWEAFVAKVLRPRHPEWAKPGEATTQPVPATRATTRAFATTQTRPTTTTGPTAELSNDGLGIVSAATQPTVVTIGDASKSRIVASLSSQGASLDSITLPEFKGPDAKNAYVFQKPYDPGNGITRALATKAITVNGNRVDLFDVAWNVESQTPKSVTFTVDLGLIRLRKIYEIVEDKATVKGFELSIRHTIENRTQQPIDVTLNLAGPTAPPRENVTGPDQQILAGYNGGYDRAAIAHHLLDEFTAKAPEKDLTKGPENAPLLWAGASSVYFEAVFKPEPLEPKEVNPKYIKSLQIKALKPDEHEAKDRQVILDLQTSDLKVAPGATLELPATAFFGPRWRKVLNDPYFATFPKNYDATLVLTSGPCGFCTFHWLINGLVALLNFFHMILRDWGLSIIALVVLVRLLLHPITKRSQISMMRMGKMGPEMERLKTKYKDDKDELNRQMMLMYKEQGIGPYLGCLPMFLQMPIWIALWSSLQTTFELRQSPFLWGIFGHWMSDLAKPDGLIRLAAPLKFWLPLMGEVSFTGLNILPIVMGGVFFMQMKLQPQPPSTTPEQEMQKKMMLWMSVLLFPLFLYNGPSGLNLYIMTSTTIGIIESKRIRDHIKQREEAEKAGKIIVDAPRGMKKDKDQPGGKKGPPAAKKTGIAGWIEQMQAKADQLRTQQDKDRK
jgi:YidC/Oxa1 family membrane protein insertase